MFACLRRNAIHGKQIISNAKKALDGQVSCINVLHRFKEMKDQLPAAPASAKLCVDEQVKSLIMVDEYMHSLSHEDQQIIKEYSSDYDAVQEMMAKFTRAYSLDALRAWPGACLGRLRQVPGVEPSAHYPIVASSVSLA